MKADAIIFLDGGYKGDPHRLAVAAVVCSPPDSESPYEIIFESAKEAGEGTSNLAEYRALGHAICMANLAGARQPVFFSDSMLMVNQIMGAWAMKGDPSSPLALEHSACSSALMRFDWWALKHVPREKNKRADWLVSKLLGHERTTKKVPPIYPVDISGNGREGWSKMEPSRKTASSVG